MQINFSKNVSDGHLFNNIRLYDVEIHENNYNVLGACSTVAFYAYNIVIENKKMISFLLSF